MKTKTLSMVCLLIGIGLTQLTAKDPVIPTDTRSISFDWVDYWYTPVVCGGVEIDFLEAQLNQHITAHFKDGVLQWYIKEVRGEVTSLKTDEVFQVKEIDKVGAQITGGSGLILWDLRLKGNLGSHYIFTGTLDINNGTLVFERAICN